MNSANSRLSNLPSFPNETRPAATGLNHFDNRLDGYALRCGNQFGEDTMLALLAEAGGDIAIMELNIEHAAQEDLVGAGLADYEDFN